MTDLVVRIEDGDSVAESELVERYARGIRLILLKRTGNPQVASDLCQDTFVVALRKLRAGHLRNRHSVAAFIRQIAVNVSIDHFRREQRYVHPSDGIIPSDLTHKDQQSDEVDEGIVKMAIDGALDRLAVPRDREILRRFYLADEGKEEICRDLGLSTTHFDRVLYRAKKRMREMINQHPRLRELLIGGLLDG